MDLKNFIYEEDDENPQELCKKLFDDMIGNNIQLDSPIKDENNKNLKHYLIYTDYTASGKSLKKLEQFIAKQILPTYANVHSTVGHCAEKTSNYFSEAKEILRNYTNAYGNYSIIFHGQGTTGAIHKLIEVLSIKKYELFYTNLETAYKIKEKFFKNYEENKSKFELLCSDLINKIKKQFKELFLEINFCYKVKENGKNVMKCMLCKKDVESEGGYHKHVKEESHILNKSLYENNPGMELLQIHGAQQISEDFIDIIRKKYLPNSKDFIYNLINDYKKFKPVVFYSLYEHNSNSLSWRELK